MHDILIKHDCDSSFQGVHYIGVNRNNMSLFAVVLCTSIPTDLCMLCFSTTFLVLALQLSWLSKGQKVQVAYLRIPRPRVFFSAWKFCCCFSCCPQHFSLAGGNNNESTSLNKAAFYAIVKILFHRPISTDHLKPLSSLVHLALICEYYLWIWKYSDSSSSNIFKGYITLVPQWLCILTFVILWLCCHNDFPSFFLEV